MPKINTIALVPIPKLSDKLVGTSVGGSPSNQTNNFTLQQLKTLFDGAPAVANLQTVLNSGNTATQNIFLTGTIDATNLDISNDSYLTNLYLSSRFFDKNNFQGTSGQYLTSTGTGVQWSTLTIPVPTLQQVLTAGNISDKNITTTGNIQSANLQGTNLTANSNLRVVGTLADSSNSVGTSGQVLSSTGLANSWVDLPTYSAVSPLIYNDPLKQFSIQVANGVQSGYLSFTDWITFDSKQPAGSYITALTGEASGAGPGVVSVTLSNLAVINKTLTGLTISGGSITAADSIITAFGKLQNQINNAISGLSYQGAWNALTNVPFLQSSVGTNGDYYVVSVAGSTNLNGITDWQVGDWAIYNGTSWQKIDNTDSVVSVNGYTGAVVLNYSDVGAPPTSRTLNINGVGYDLSADRFWTVGDVRTDQTYSNPSWISSLAWGKITNTPTTLAGYGITDAVSTSRTLSINGTTYDLSANRSWSVGTVTSISTSAPITGGIITGSGTIGINQSSASSDGYLSSTDWTTFNSKQSTLSLTTIGSSGSSTLISNVLNVPTYTLSGLGGVPTTRELTINGTTYDLSANRSWSVGTVTSVGLTMPSAFGVANTPITGSGTINVTALGNATQYIRGDGVLADFPGGGGGGGASVFYYLNGSVNQGTFGGNTYYEMSKTPVLGAGTDFSINTDGYIAQFITDAGEPNAFLIPGGNWNLEFYFSASSGGGSPTFYAELYKYDGTTFTLIADNSTNPELISLGTTVAPYFSALAVPETPLSITDRLAIRVYVNHSGRTITMHTENSNLCQVITTFTTGLTALNGLTQQVQYFATGTSGSDFNIVSSVATHTFNLPTASSVNRGALSTSDWITFNSKQDAISLTTTGNSGSSTFISNVLNVPTYTLSGLGGVPISRQLTINGTAYDLSADRSWSVGTVTSVGLSSATSGVTIGSTPVTGSGTITLAIATATATQNGLLSSTDWSTFNSKQNTITLTTTGNSGSSTLIGSTLNIPTYTLSGLGGVPTSRTITINGTTQDLSADRTYSVGTVTSVAALTLGTSGTDLSSSVANGTTTPVITLNVPTASATNRGALSASDWSTFNSKQNAITLTTTGTSGAATLIGSTLNIPQYQSVLTNPITGTGTTNYLPKFTGSTTIGDSIFTESGGNTLRIIAANAAVRLSGSREYLLQTVDADGRFRIYDQTAALERVTLTSSGNLLVGTTTDNGARLQVNGTSTFSDIITATSNIHQVSTGGLYWGAPSTYVIGVTGNTASGNLSFITGSTVKATITSDGNVGIGTNAPLGKIHSWQGSSGQLSPNSVANGLIIEDNQSQGISILTPSTNEGNIFFGDESDNFIGGIRYFHTDDSLTFTANNAERWRITSTGILQSNGAQTIQTSTGNLTLATAAGNGNIVLTPNGTGISLIENTVVGNIARFLSNTANGQQLTILSTATGVQIRSAFSTGIAGSFEIFASGGSSTLSFGTASTERMRITSTGNVLIGTTVDDGGKLKVLTGAVGTVAQFRGAATDILNIDLDDNAVVFDSRNVAYTAFENQGAERLRITSGGNVGIGTTTPSTLLDIRGTGEGIYVARNTANAFGSHVRTQKSRGTVLAPTIVVNGDTTGTITFEAYNGTSYSEATGIIGVVNGTVSAGSTPTDLLFSAGASGTTAANERMRITSGGNVLIGTTTDIGSRLGIKSSGTNSFPLIIQRNANTNTLAAISETSGGDGSFLLANSLGSTNIQLLSNGTSILNGGNVLIGTTNDPGATLHVGGTIRTGAPSGGSAVNWRLGTARAGTVTSNATVRVEIDGVLVDLVARYV